MRDRESARYWLTLFDKYKIFFLLCLTDTKSFIFWLWLTFQDISLLELLRCRSQREASYQLRTEMAFFTQFSVSDLSLKIFWTLIWKPLKHIYFHLMMLRSIFLSSSVTCNGSMRLGMEIIWEGTYWGWRSLRREFYVDYCSGYWQWEDQFSPYINDKTLIRNEVDTW